MDTQEASGDDISEPGSGNSPFQNLLHDCSNPQIPSAGLEIRKTRCRPADIVSNPFFVTAKSESQNKAGARSPGPDSYSNDRSASPGGTPGSDSTNHTSQKQEPPSVNVTEQRMMIHIPNKPSQVETPEGTSGYKCDTCGKIMLRLSSIQSHMKVHREEVLFKCKFCGKAYTELARLTDHEDLEHAGMATISYSVINGIIYTLYIQVQLLHI